MFVVLIKTLDCMKNFCREPPMTTRNPDKEKEKQHGNQTTR
jgi:hypothetical protein